MFVLVDCDSFYASCEQVFRPDLRGKPVVVLSNNDGCLIARSPRAKALGIPDLLPYFKIRALLDYHQTAVFSANYTLYGDLSWRFMEVVRQIAGQVEPYSIDEMFAWTDSLNNSLLPLADHLQTQVWQQVRLPVRVGIGPTKTLAKLANALGKSQSRNCVLQHPNQWRPLLARTPVTQLWGINKQLAKRLAAFGIVNAQQLADAPGKLLRRVHNVELERLVGELNGEVCYPLHQQPEPKQQILVSRSFSHRTQELKPLQQHLSRYAAVAAEKLRQQQSQAHAMQVLIQTPPFEQPYYSNQLTIPFPYGTSDTRLLIALAKQMAKDLYRPGYRFGRCGVGLLELSDDQVHQQDWRTGNPEQKSAHLMAVVDRINRQFGRDSAVFAAEGFAGKWSMHQRHLSPAYTTQWHALPKVRC